MAVHVIDTIKPKNNGTFPVVEAVDVKVTNDKRLDAALNDKANQSDLAALQTTVSGKASQADLTALSETVSGKASQADLTTLSNTVDGKQNALSTAQLAACNSGITSELVTQIGTNTTAIAGKASQSDLAALSDEVDDKADEADLTTATTNLQSQIDNIVSGSTADSEVINARVGADGTSYNTLKTRIDTEVTHLQSAIDINNTVKTANVILNFEAVSGYYNKSGEYQEYSDIQRADITVNAGEIYLLTSSSYYGVARVVFFDSNDDVVSTVWTSGDTATHIDTKVIVPNNAVKMGLQRYSTKDVVLERKYDLINSEKTVYNTETVDSAISKINNAINVAFDEEYEAVTLSFTSATGFYNKGRGFSTFADISTCEVNVVPGEKYLLTSKSFFNMARAAFLDQDSNVVAVIWNSNDESVCVDTVIIIPVKATKMLLQRFSTNGVTLNKYVASKLPSSNVIHNGETVQSNLNRLGDTIDDISEKIYSNVPTVFSSASGFYGKDGSYAEYSEVYVCELSVTTGEQYLLSSKSFYDMARAVFFDDSDNFVGSVWTSNDDAENVNTRVTVPAHAVKMLLQRYSTNSVKLDKYTHSTTTAQKTIYGNETVKSNLDYLNVGYSSAIRNVYSDVSLTFTSVTGYYNRFGGYSEYADMSACDIVVTVGERYSLTSKSFYDAVRAAFLDANDNLISFVWSSADTKNNVNTEIIVPNGAVKMRLQRHGSDAVILGKYASSRTGNSLVSKKITVIGDSITEYNYRAKINWPLYMAEWTGAEFQNLGVSGTGFATSYQPYINRIASIQEFPDLIGVALSWNDLAAGLPVGETTDTGTSSLCGYANDFFTALITAFPTVPIICYCQGPWGSARPGIASSDNWYAALETICKNKGVPFYGHLYIGGVLKPWIAANQAEYYVTDNDITGNVGLTDQVHPNSKGHKYIATYFMQKFAQNVAW